MDTSIPYQPGMLLGRSVDLSTLQLGYLPTGTWPDPTSLQMNMTTCQFSFVHTLRDVCDILSIPPEYALKVSCSSCPKFDNSVVAQCLHSLQEKNVNTLVVRTSFLQQKQYMGAKFMSEHLETSEGEGHPPVSDVKEQGSQQEGSHVGIGDEGSMQQDTGKATGQESRSTESLLAEAAGDTSLTARPKHGTHWVKAIEIGNELIILLTLRCEDPDKRSKLFLKLCNCLGSYRGLVDEQRLANLTKVASEIDQKLSKAHYRDVQLEIHYGTYQNLPSYPADLSGMVKVIEEFSDQCQGWAELYKHGGTAEVESRSITSKLGVDRTKKPSLADSLMHKLADFKLRQEVLEYHPKRDTDVSDATEESDDSFVVLNSAGPHFFYQMRATLQAFETDCDHVQDKGMSLSSFAISQYPEATYTLFDQMYTQLTDSYKATQIFQDFLSQTPWVLTSHVEGVRNVLKHSQTAQVQVEDLVNQLDFISLPLDHQVKTTLDRNPLDVVKVFTQEVSSSLPPGCDLDLLMIGKTGHGKSSTGNSILGRNKFYSSPDPESVTTQTSVGWAEIDGRTIKVVDTPGVCDTSHSSDESSIDVAIRSISEAIANCPNGFHALLLVIRFGIRMTMEERKAIGLLKCVLGEDIIKKHTVCVITYGDNFFTEMSESKTTFDKWCHTQDKGFLKELFEECEYRCVLFNNKATENRQRKQQLIQLVAQVDSLKARGTRYTNSIFEFAQHQRQKIIGEKCVPEVSEDMMRDMQLILDYLNTMVHNTDQEEQYRQELCMLKDRVDNLSNRLTETESTQLSTLVDAVFALAATVHAKMDEIADRTEPDSPDHTQPDSPEQATKSCSPPDAVVGESSVDTSETAQAPDQQTGCQERVENRYDNTDFARHQSQVQEFVDKMSPQTQQVTQDVADQVAAQVKKEKNCFPGSATVICQGGYCLPLETLGVGTQVLVRTSDGSLAYQPVYMYGHRDHDSCGLFIVLRSASHRLCVTKEHYVYCVREGRELCLPAQQVQLGDQLLVLAGTDQLTKHPVVSITCQVEKGLFAPFTPAGTLVVDGVLSSCYVDVLAPNLCHKLLWPARQLYHISPATLALLNGTTREKSQPMPQWVRFIMQYL